MRRAPQIPCPLPTVLGPARRPLVDIELAVVTPLFGGGAKTRESDPLSPVRGASVRGHLRFWWRVCQAHRYATPSDLFREESRLWGATASRSSGQDDGGPSLIEVVVEAGGATPVVVREASLWRQWQNRLPAYVVWPFREERQQGAPPALDGVSFRLRLLLASHAKNLAPVEQERLEREAVAAVRAWVLFGGIGARTRRGCGSLWCRTPDERFRPPPDLRQWPPLPSPRTDLLLPVLTGARLLLKPDGAVREPAPGHDYFPDPAAPRRRPVRAPHAVPTLDAWWAAVELMRRYRQEPGIGRHRGGKVPGPSRWPEADSLRGRPELQLSTMGDRPHHQARPYYPRADLGLPIVFQQMGGRSTPTLQAAASDRRATRMASPVILKALAVSEQQAVPCAVLLNAPHPWDPGAPGVAVGAGERLPGDQLHSAERSRRVPLLGPDRSARDGFMTYSRWAWDQGEIEL